MPQIILQYLPYLFQAAKAVPQIIDYIKKTRANLLQSGEWTEEMEAAYVTTLDKMENDPAWKVEEGK